MFILGFMFIIMLVPITHTITSHLQKMARIKQEIVDQEIELEKLKQQNYIAETNKLRLELEQKKLTVNEILQDKVE